MDLLGLIEERLTKAQEELESVLKEETRIAARKELLRQDIDVWAGALNTERRSLGLVTKDAEASDSVSTPLVELTNSSPVGVSENESGLKAAYGSKGEFLRGILKKNARNGIPPRDIRKAARDAGLECGTSFPYSALNKMKNDGEAMDKDGKWFPMSNHSHGSLRTQ